MMCHGLATSAIVNFMESQGWLDEQEQSAWRAFMSMQTKLIARLANQLNTNSGLSYPDYEVLVALTDQEDGQLRNYELTEALAWEQSRLSHHIGRMEKRGLVVRVRCPSDKRGSFVQITNDGRSAIEAAAPGHVQEVRRLIIDRLSSQELEALASISEKILAGFVSDDESETIVTTANEANL